MTSTSLYRHFGADGELLYVGISLSWPARTKAHAGGSIWFGQVTKVEIEHFPDRETALQAERDAIKSERPKFNVIHNRPQKAVVSDERRKLRVVHSDPLLKAITGPDAIVGPPLIYRDDLISIIVAHGNPGTAGNLTEIVLGEFFPEAPAWTDVCASVISIRLPNQITIKEAQDMRREIVSKLRKELHGVDTYETDLALAVAYASLFPSDKSRQVLDGVAIERGAVA